MSRGRQYIQFEGLFAAGVLGIFKIIRGFANLQDLAAVSVPYEMMDSELSVQVVGHQRELDQKHAEDIKKYLEYSDNRFIPEVILSVRCEAEPIQIENAIVGVQTQGDGPIEMGRHFGGKNQRIQKLRVRRNQLNTVKNEKLIRRIDGNHRLALAEHLQEDINLPQKYLAPFCMVLLAPPEDEDDDFSESLIFHTINSTAQPLESEHGLRLLLGQNPAYAMPPDKEFSHSPELHLTRLLADRLTTLPEHTRRRFGERPLTAMWDSAVSLINMDTTISENPQKLKKFADVLFAVLTDIAILLKDNHPSLCNTHSFLELAARVWCKAKGNDYDEKVRWAVDYLDRIGHWLGTQGITSLLNPLSPAKQLLETFEAVQSRMPKRVFLARWYPAQDDPNDAYRKARLRLQQLRNTLEAIEQEHRVDLKLIDLGTETGGTFPIHSRIYGDIASSDIIICDLTGQRPNVYVEAGYALNHLEKNRLIFLFQPADNTDTVPFDLSTFKYIKISEAAEIPDELRPAIEAILTKAGANLSGGVSNDRNTTPRPAPSP